MVININICNLLFTKLPYIIYYTIIKHIVIRDNNDNLTIFMYVININNLYLTLITYI